MENDCAIEIIFACRNKSKAESAKLELIAEKPDAVIDILVLDTSELHSVYQAAQELKKM